MSSIGSEQLFSKILNNTSTCVFWKDTERRFMGVNKAFLDYYGFDSQEVLIGKTDEEMGWHSDPDPFMNDELRVLRYGENTVRVHGKCFARGQERDILASKSPIYDGGSIVGLVGTFEDVTEDLWQKEKIKDLEGMLNAIPCGICICRMSFGKEICISANDFFLKMTGSEGIDVAGRDTEDIFREIHKDDLLRVRESESELCRDGKPMDEIFRFYNREKGEYVWLRAKGRRARLRDDEELQYYTFTDENDLKNTEKREVALRKLYSSSVEAARLIVWKYDIGTHTVIFDDTGYTARRCEELGLPLVFHDIPEKLYGMIAGEYHDEIRRMYNDVFRGVPYTTGDIVFRASAELMPIYLHISYTTVLDRDGKPQMAYGTAQNITKEKTAEMQYEHEVTYLNSDKQRGFIAKGHHDLTANKVLGYYVGINSAMDVTGMTYDDAYEHLFEYIHYAEDRRKYADIFQRKKLIDRFHSDETYFSMEYRRSDHIYSVMWAQMEIRTFQNPATGHIECFIYSFDITGKRISSQLTNNLRNIGYEWVGLINVPKNKVTFFYLEKGSSEWNVRGESIDYDLNSEKVIKDSVIGDTEEYIKACRLENVVSALDSDGKFSLSYSCNDRKGMQRRKYLSFGYLYGDSSIVFLSVQDITEQYAKEQKQIEVLQEAMSSADRANRAKTDFLSRMSHDIRTPLNGIIGMTYFARKEQDPEKVGECLDKIDTSSKFLLGLINDILDMSKAESGAVELHPEPYSPAEFSAYMNAVVMPLVAEKNQTIKYEIKNTKGFVPLLDKLHVNQIVFNILSNAVKFTPEGGRISYKAECTMLSDSRMRTHIQISDNGIGMSEDFRKILFEPFTQENRNDVSYGRGTGLGMAITKRLIDLMGGTISVKSSPGKGTAFDIYLKTGAAADTLTRESGAADKGTDSGRVLKNKRILICEDHPLNQEIAKKLLEEKGMKAEVAEDGGAGVRAFRNSSLGYYDAILMDIRMPVMDGYAAAAAIRSLDRKDAVSVPIIAMTADAFEDDVKKCFSAGMNGHIAKPIDPEVMYELLAEKIMAKE